MHENVNKRTSLVAIRNVAKAPEIYTGRRYPATLVFHMKIAAICALAAVALAAETPLMKPEDLAVRLQAKGARPTMIQVGRNELYRQRHIAGSIYAGPGNTPAGLNALRAAVASLPRDAEIVIYCGCCPWEHCPNMKPAMRLLSDMGFKRAKALYTPTNLAKDWTDKGYPVESSLK